MFGSPNTQGRPEPTALPFTVHGEAAFPAGLRDSRPCDPPALEGMRSAPVRHTGDDQEG